MNIKQLTPSQKSIVEAIMKQQQDKMLDLYATLTMLKNYMDENIYTEDPYPVHMLSLIINYLDNEFKVIQDASKNGDNILNYSSYI